MFNRHKLGNAVVFLIGFAIPLSLIGCGINTKSLVVRQSMAPAPVKSTPQPVVAPGPLTVYAVSAAVATQTDALTISWEVAPNLDAFYDVWSCDGADRSTCSPFLIVDCVTTPGSCAAYDPVRNKTANLSANGGPIQFTTLTLPNGHQLIKMSDALLDSMPDMSVAVDARDTGGSAGTTQFSL